MDENGSTAEPAAPLAQFQRWLVQLRDHANPAYTYIRRVELGFDAIRSDTKKPLKGVRVASNLVMTRNLMFFQLIGRKKARAMSLEEVATQYSIDELRDTYRKAMDAWKYKKKVG